LRAKLDALRWEGQLRREVGGAIEKGEGRGRSEMQGEEEGEEERAGGRSNSITAGAELETRSFGEIDKREKGKTHLFP
jgi:hypothetical protein